MPCACTPARPQTTPPARPACAPSHGADIVLGRPARVRGGLGERFLLAHEVAHVVQRSADTPPGHGGEPIDRFSGARDPLAERDADRIAVRLAFGLGAARVGHRPAIGTLLASPLSDSVESIWLATADKAQVFDALRAASPATDPDLDALLPRLFAAGTDDLWLARTLARQGPEPLWPAAAFNERRRRQRDHGWAEERGAIRGTLATTAGGRPVEAFFFPGTSDERALVVAGVHGSEQGGIEVAEMLIQTLRNAVRRPHYSVIVVPTLFPDNATTRTRERATPTNRNFPAPGQSLDSATPFGTTTPMDTGSPPRPILAENIALMRLIERFRPSRVASVHGTWDRGAAGIFSDAHTVSAQARARAIAAHLGDPVGMVAALVALKTAAAGRTDDDEALALSMARAMDAAGFDRSVRGNQLGSTPTAGWSGSVPGGTSFGGWGPQDITEGRATDRPSMTVLTVEVATNTRSTDFSGAAEARRRAELASYRDVIQDIFLGPP